VFHCWSSCLRSVLLLLIGASIARAAADSPRTVTLVETSSLSPARKLTLLALQGLANRSGPAVFLDFGDDNRWMQMDFTEDPGRGHLQSWNPDTPPDFKSKCPTTAKAWVEILEASAGFKFEPRPWERFLADAGKASSGWLVYDHFEDEVALMGTLAGLKNALPVLRDDLGALQEILPGMPVVFDASSIPSLPGQGRKVSVHRWMIEHLLPQVSKSGIVSRVKNYGLEQHDTFVDIDQAVQEKWLVYDLTHYREDTSDQPDPRHSRPDETAALHDILKSYPPLTPVFGWGAVDENTFVRVITEQGLTVICSGIPNNSFFNRWKASSHSLKQRHRHVVDSSVTVDDKIHLALMVNEGDSIKNALALQGHGAWLQPERGSVPLNWGVDPALFERYSGLMEYYYQSATSADYFFAAAAGWGYAHPNRMTPPMAQTYVSQVNKGLVLSDTDYIDIWWLPHSGPVWDAFARGLKVKGLTQWYAPEQKVDYTNADFPVAFSNHYYTLDEPEKFARMLIQDYQDVKGPWFVVVYGANRHMTPYKAKSLMDHLPPDRFKAVLLDEFFSAARLARKEVEGRVWRPGPDAPKGEAP
jgi:hypothetical protein